MQKDVKTKCFLTFFNKKMQPFWLHFLYFICDSHAYFEDGIVQDEDNPLLTKVQQ